MSAAKLARLASFTLLIIVAVWLLLTADVRLSLLVFAAAAYVAEGLL